MEEDEEKGNDKEKEKPLDDHIDTKVYEDKVNIGHEENGTCEGLKTMEISPSSTCLPCEIPSCDVKVLEGHTSGFCLCMESSWLISCFRIWRFYSLNLEHCKWTL